MAQEPTTYDSLKSQGYVEKREVKSLFFFNLPRLESHCILSDWLYLEGYARLVPKV